MMIAMVVIYALSWLPIHAITLIGDNYPDIYSESYINIVWIAAHWTAMSHSCYNPIVYFSMNSKFRAGFLKVFKCCPGAKQEQQLINDCSKRFCHGSTCTTTVNLNKANLKRNVITNYCEKSVDDRESSVVWIKKKKKKRTKKRENNTSLKREFSSKPKKYSIYQAEWTYPVFFSLSFFFFFFFKGNFTILKDKFKKRYRHKIIISPCDLSPYLNSAFVWSESSRGYLIWCYVFPTLNWLAQST